ncbi:MAG: cofactor-independent phosphoglycerate mutase [Defluviitaleaceae bacterium]|nr:cofactor-independent phosphoglycerate mutase [Defluviitaleaceae bacterium]
MKYIIILGDGMADRPVPELNNLTPLQKARKPNMDFIAKNGHMGLVRTIPKGMPPGSDTANLSVLGIDPVIYHTGRSSLEAVSIGINLNKNDLAYRCNLVTINCEGDIMSDHSAGEISTDEAKILIEDLAKALDIELHVGTSYRHCLVIRDGTPGSVTIPPHDFTGQKFKNRFPQGENSELFSSLIKKSWKILENHPVNLERIRQGKNPANSIWLWGEGKAPALPSFYDKYALTGAVISAVDLIKGIGISIGFESINVRGATGTLHTNYAGKAAAALDALKAKDFVYLHIEAPDECSHRGKIYDKVLAIEYIDEKIIAPVIEELNKRGDDYSILVMPDHPTPLDIMTHTDDPVPFAYYRKNAPANNNPSITGFDEINAAKTGVYIEKGHILMDEFIV